jgi:heme A synthase
VATIIEYTHRTTSGLAFMMVLTQLVWALRAFPRGHGVRRAAGAAMLLMVTEALVGAGLVIFEKVAGDKSVGRALWTMAHLGNTFALLAAMVLVRWRTGAPRSESEGGRTLTFLYAAMAGTLVVAMTGAIAALGDTLFPARTLVEGLRQDLDASAHLFVRLRGLHPFLAVATGLSLLAICGGIVARGEPRGLRGIATTAAALVLLQLTIGVVNLGLLAPIPLQLTHLVVADLLWMTLVLMAAELHAGRATARASVARAA